MEEIVAEHLRVEHAHALGGQRRRSMPAASSAATSSEPMPLTRSIVSTLSPVSGPVHFRHVQVVGVQPEPAHQAGVGALALQVEFGVQRVLDFDDHLAAAGSSRHSDGGDRPARPGCAAGRCRPRSARAMFGRSTLTTTSRPSCSVAACTCAIEAEASGVSSKLANSSAIGLSSATLDLPCARFARRRVRLGRAAGSVRRRHPPAAGRGASTGSGRT